MSLPNKVTEQVKIRLISQLSSIISRVLQKLSTYLNGTIISTFFVPLPLV